MAIRRRWFQFSLRGFLVVLTIGCVWLGWKVEKARKRGRAIDAIVAMGATAYYVSPADSTIAINTDHASHWWADLKLTPVNIELDHLGVSKAAYALVVDAKPIRRLDIFHHIQDLQVLEQLNGLNDGCDIVIHFVISDKNGENVQRLLPRANVRWFHDLNVCQAGHPRTAIATRTK